MSDSNIPDYQPFLTLTYVLTGNSLLLLLHLDHTTNHLDIPFSCWFRGIWIRSIFPGDSSVSTGDAEGPGECGLSPYSSRIT